MRQNMASRSQRRVEKRQATVFLALVLAVSLVSFALGIMVGRMSSSPEIVQAPPPPPDRVSVAAPPAASRPSETAAAPVEELTFFETLPKSDQPPMGSGINLPRQTKPSRSEEAKAPPTPPSSAQEVIKNADPPPRPAAAPSSVAAAGGTIPPASPGGGYTLQIASFQDAVDALRLKERLVSLGYSSYTEQADLGEKGVWTRVLVGPYESEQHASAAASRLRAEEKLTPLVRRR